MLIPTWEATRENFQALGKESDVLQQAAVIADAGFHTRANMQYLIDNGIYTATWPIHYFVSAIHALPGPSGTR